MSVHDLEEQLRAEGFTHTYVWQDGPGAYYPEHTHSTVTAHVVLEGEVTVISEGKTQTYRDGDRIDIPAQTLHAATMGPKGCRYIIGEK